MSIKTSLVSNKSTIYHCKKLTATSWASPVEKRLSIMPTTDTGDMFAYGVNFPQYLKCKCSISEAEDFTAGDKIYFRKVLPTTHNPMQNKVEDCNFEVSSNPQISKNIGDVRFKHLANR